MKHESSTPDERVGADSLRRLPVLACAAALVGLGALSLYHADPLLQWQPVPKGAPWRSAYGLISGGVLVVGGVGLLWARSQKAAAAAVAAWIGAWVVLLHLPAVVAGKGPIVPALLGVAECSAMALGLATIAYSVTAFRIWQIPFGLCLVMFGISHFAYAEFTASMVPGWLPWPLFIAYATGAVHTLTGLAIMIGRKVRLAALLEAGMMSSFVLLLHVPRVLAMPDRTELTMLGIAALLTAAVGLAACSAGRGRVSAAARRKVGEWPSIRGSTSSAASDQR